jgi:hypothetical protein
VGPFRERINEMISNALDRLLSRVGGQKSLGVACCGSAFARGDISSFIGFSACGFARPKWRKWRSKPRIPCVLAGVDSSRPRSRRQGDYRMAIHCAYWAGIARLQDWAHLAPDRAKTPREYLRALTKSKCSFAGNAGWPIAGASMLTSRWKKSGTAFTRHRSGLSRLPGPTGGSGMPSTLDPGDRKTLLIAERFCFSL